MGTQDRNNVVSDAMQRVKVYHLNDEGKWDDRGTGHVTVDYLEVQFSILDNLCDVLYEELLRMQARFKHSFLTQQCWIG